MPGYRLYFLNPRSGHFEGVEKFHSADDVEAVCLVGQRKDQVPTELWRGGKKVARFDAQPLAASAAPDGAQPRSLNR